MSILAVAISVHREIHITTTTTERPSGRRRKRGAVAATAGALLLVGKRRVLRFEIGNQVRNTLKRPVVCHLTLQHSQVLKFLVDLFSA